MPVTITPYLMMNGNAKEAIQFYEQTLGAEVLTIITYRDMPDSPSEDLKELIAHAKIKIEEAALMFSDTPGPSSITSGNQVTICISTNDVEKSKRFFEALTDGGRVKMPFQETSFSPGYGSVTDKFGVTFQIDTEAQG
ncbi:VOC family protein [Halalkalibacter oceani]|uniref:VOC family protein n=1 Tax=Halalkalibacter oceani TaxID=1653776 RepID=A0A9X2DTB5_9BACI|nr:VOC family protein [Halalkalibacter oceani]MCM3716072.1 VOC family protein [Halalkalibacter oceani]